MSMTLNRNNQQRGVLLTGGASGLGRAMAIGLKNAGYHVVIADRSQTLIDETLAISETSEGNGVLSGICVDLSQSNVVSSLFQQAEKLTGGIDILVNNAGLGPAFINKDYMTNPPHFDDLSEEMVRLFFELNSITPMLLCVAATRQMRAKGWGRIVNITTSLDSMTRRGYAPYGGTKASLEAHSAIMAKDVESSGVTVNVLIPGGPANTAMIPKEAGFDRSKLIEPDVMVPPLLWLLSESGAAVNGQRIIAANWTPEGIEQPSISPIGWSNLGSIAIFPS
jgi:3-oxoacyl-[acyl-carrier protein] reductase